MIAGPVYVGGDLGRKRDLTSVVAVERVAARRPEASDHLVVRVIYTWDPKAGPAGEVDFAEVRAALGALPEVCAQLEAVVIDEGAEGGAVLPFCRSHPGLSLKVRGFQASVDSNMKLWGALAARLHSRTLTLPRHPRLVAELRNLRLESFALGSRWRVVDSSRQFHRDISFSLALAVWAAGETAAYAAADVGYDALGSPGMRPGPESEPAAPRARLFPDLDLAAAVTDRGATVDPEWVENQRRVFPRRDGGRFWGRSP
jgi:hypothetical protein